jgi:hypothetical protein
MTVIHELPCRPKPDIITAFVQRLFEHVPAAHKGLVELAWTSTRKPHDLRSAKLFDLADLDTLASYAAALNAAPNRNAYISAGLRRSNTPTNARSQDADVFALAAIKADCDAQGSFSATMAVMERIGITPSLAVITGRHPYTRAQLWWILDEPTEDLALARQIERAIAHKCGTDTQICNPSRVMRLAGSVAWPLKEGRQVEMTDLQTMTAEPYNLNVIAERLRAAGAMPVETQTKILDFNDADPTLDLEQLILAAAEQGRWHRHALLAVAHLLGRGCPPDIALELLTPRLQQPGYTYQQTRSDLLVMVKGAINRGLYHPYTPTEPPPEPPLNETPEQEQPKQRDPFPLMAIDQIDATPAPSWRIEGYLPERGFGVLFGASGTFKSFIALDMALSVAHGLDWRGCTVTPAPCVYIAGEGSYGIANRIRVWVHHRKQDAPCTGFWLAPVAANFLDKKYVQLIIDRLLALPERPRFVIVDTLARSFGAGDENDAKDMNAFVAACDYLVARLDCFVLAIHHSGKDSERGARGSSVLRAAADVEIKVTRGSGDMIASIVVTKQKDAEEVSARSMRLVPAEATHPETGEIISSLLPTLDEAVDPSKGSSCRLTDAQREVIDLLEVGSGSLATLVARSGKDKSNLRRTLNGLITMNIVHRDDRGVYALVVNPQTQ